MKFLFVHFLFLLSVANVNAQQSEIRSLESFRGLKASQGIDVYLKQGGKESARIETSGINLQNIITEVSGNYLKIYLKDGHYNNSRNIKVYITYVEINKLSASSAASIFSEGTLKVKEMDISSSSASSIEIRVESTSLKVSASSAGEIDLKGKTVNLNVE